MKKLFPEIGAPHRLDAAEMRLDRLEETVQGMYQRLAAAEELLAATSALSREVHGLIEVTAQVAEQTEILMASLGITPAVPLKLLD